MNYILINKDKGSTEKSKFSKVFFIKNIFLDLFFWGIFALLCFFGFDSYFYCRGIFYKTFKMLQLCRYCFLGDSIVNLKMLRTIVFWTKEYNVFYWRVIPHKTTKRIIFIPDYACMSVEIVSCLYSPPVVFREDCSRFILFYALRFT